jgi:hypothetical protein
VAPILAKTLEPPVFGRTIRVLFPAYYALGMGAAALGLATRAGQVAGARASGTDAMMLGLWGCVFALEWYSRSALTPRMNALRDLLTERGQPNPQEEQKRREWDSLHRRAVQINGVVLVVGLIALGFA